MQSLLFFNFALVSFHLWSKHVCLRFIGEVTNMQTGALVPFENALRRGLLVQPSCLLWHDPRSDSILPAPLAAAKGHISLENGLVKDGHTGETTNVRAMCEQWHIDKTGNGVGADESRRRIAESTGRS